MVQALRYKILLSDVYLFQSDFVILDYLKHPEHFSFDRKKWDKSHRTQTQQTLNFCLARARSIIAFFFNI